MTNVKTSEHKDCVEPTLEQGLKVCLEQARAIRKECKDQLRFNDGDDAADVCCAIRAALALLQAQGRWRA